MVAESYKPADVIKLKLLAAPLGRMCEVWINGQHVGGVRRIEFTADAEDLVRVRMDFHAEIEVEGEIFDDMFEAWQHLGEIADAST